MADTLWGDAVASIDLSRLSPCNGILHNDRPRTVITAPEQWSYAAAADLNLPTSREVILLKAEATITSGRIGVGCVLDDFSTFVDEVELAAGAAPQVAWLILPPDMPVKSFVVRNVAANGVRSEALLHSLEIVRPSLEARGDVPAPAVLRPTPNWARHYGRRSDRLDERLRQLWYDNLKAPCVIPWLNNLKLNLLPRNEMLRALYVSGLYEPNSLLLLADALTPSSVFVDVGANIGLYTLFAASLIGNGGKVMAIEASSREFKRLTDNITLNGLKNIRARHVALYDRPGTVEISIADEQHGGHNTLAQAFVYDSVAKIMTETVVAETLDRLVESERLDRVDLIKLDIEGGELKALKGARETLKRFQPVLLIEVIERGLALNGGSVAELEAELVALGYRFWQIDDVTAARRPLSSLAEAQSENIVASVRDLPKIGSGQFVADSRRTPEPTLAAH